MIYRAKIINGDIVFDNKREVVNDLKKFEDKSISIEITKPTRTTKQNRALHLYFKLLSEELNNAGLDVKKTLSQNISHPWTETLVKELIWRPVQKSYLIKQSTKRIRTDDIDKIYEVINLWLGEKFGLHVTFPCIEELMFNYDKETKINK